MEVDALAQVFVERFDGRWALHDALIEVKFGLLDQAVVESDEGAGNEHEGEQGQSCHNAAGLTIASVESGVHAYLQKRGSGEW